jgi:hypothetical protein
MMGMLGYKGGWVRTKKTTIHYWRFEDGKKVLNSDSCWPMDPPPRGWYCWVYAKDNDEFHVWMAKNCPTAECINRFNSGDPMTTVYIREDREATLFQLKWL